MNKVELLSPAGNFECLKAAVNSGADAVYLGGNNFSARAFADNFNNEEIIEAIQYAHLRNVKIFVTVNTILSETELENAYQYVEFLYKHNVDAIIIQDLGLFYRLRQKYKDLELHASTQMHIHNLQGVKVAKELGFSRIVLARESDLSMIKQCTKEGIDVECFVHGAICVSYSGQCLLSAFTKSRSANKGMCAQCCRLRYSLEDENSVIKTDSDYLLSPKDMFLINDIPDLIKAGVHSFKIEGRLKSPAYVAYTTKMYRKAIDAYYANEGFQLSGNEQENLKLLFNRGFTNVYLKPDTSKQLFHNQRPNHMGVTIGKIIKTYGSSSYIKLEKEVHQFDGIRALNDDNDSGMILNMFKLKGLLANKALPGDIIEVNFKEKVKVGDIVVKTQDALLEKDILNYKNKQLPLYLNVIAEPLKPLKIDASIDNLVFHYESKTVLDIALNRPITKENIIDCFDKKENHPYFIEEMHIEMKDCFISIKQLNEIRREFYSQFDDYRLNSFQRVIVNKNDYNYEEIVINNNQKPLIEGIDSIYEFEKLINLKGKYKNQHRVVKELGGLLKDNKEIAYYTFNVMNSYAYEFLLKCGFQNVILSLEINDNQIKLLQDAFKKRLGIDANPYVFVYGRRVLMNIRNNPFKEYMNKGLIYHLNDGTNRLLIHELDEFTELIESKPYIRENELVFGTIPFLKVNDTSDLNNAKKGLKSLNIA